MRQMIKNTLTIVTLLLISMGAFAEGEISKKTITLDGVASSEEVAGTVTYSNGVITVTPASGNYLTIDDLTVIKTIDGSKAQTRTDPSINTPVTLTAQDPTADPSKETKYTFTVPGEEYDYEITANFHSRTSIENAVVTVTGGPFTYSGEAIKPEVEVKLGANTLTKGSEYDVYYKDSINAGENTGKIILVGIRKYKGMDGSWEAPAATYTIGKAEIKPVVAITEWTYGATANEPRVTEGNPGNGEVTFAYKEKDAADDTYAGEVPANIGDYTVRATIAETDNYKGGTATANFAISAKSIAGATITLTPESFTYNGQNQKPEVSVKDGEMVLTLDTDYTLTNEGGTDLGEYTVTVTGKGNYDPATTATKTFTIKKDTRTGLAFSTDEATAIMGEPFISPTLTNPNNLPVIYSSTNENVAMATSYGKIAILGPGVTTIKAFFAGNDTFNAVEVSYVLTVSLNENTGLAFSKEQITVVHGEDVKAPTLTNPHKLKITYESSDKKVATVDNEGNITTKGEGEATISAVFAGNNTYKEQTVSYVIVVKAGYDLWIDDKQVTVENKKDILGNGCFFFEPSRNLLVVAENETPVVVESGMADLVIYLNGSSKLERIFFGNRGAAQSAALNITGWGNIPGQLELGTTNEDGVISGFKSLKIDEKALLYLIDPVEGVYNNGKLVDNDNHIAMSAIIGQDITPFVNGETKTFKEQDFVSGGKDVDLTNTIIDNILYTLVQNHPDPEDNDGYDSEEHAIVINTTMATDGVMVMANRVTENEIRPGTEDFAEIFKGMTFMVPSGEGQIIVTAAVEEGYRMMMQVGNSEATAINPTAKDEFTIPYNVGDHPDYVYLFMVKANGTRIGKREKAHGHIYSIAVAPAKTAKNPLNDTNGYPENKIPEVKIVTIDITGIMDIPVNDQRVNNDDRWFTIDGQQIDKPTKKGIYIHQGKKVVIK